MPGRGPLPADHSARKSDDVRRHGTRLSVTADEEVRGFELPTGYYWHEQTVQWWENWRRSPLSQLWTPQDWDFLLDTALMHTAMWAKGNWTLAAEVRLRVAKLGATVEDRQRLRLSIDKPMKNNVSVMDKYRQAASE